MKYLYLIFILSLVGCFEKRNIKIEKYPGIEPSYHYCHNLWNLGYKFDVLKCEASFDNPKFKIGEKVKFNNSKYDKSCNGIILGIFGWAIRKPHNDQATYRYKVYCDKKPIH